MVKCGGSRVDGIIMDRRQNNYRKFGPFSTQRIVESSNLGFPKKCRKGELQNPMRNLQITPASFSPFFYTNSFIIIEKPAAVKNRAFDNDIFFYNCVGDHTADRNPVSGMLCHGLRPS